MCIVVDPPTLIPIFKQSDPRHSDFAPVRNWVMFGPGKLVLGGTKYKGELSKVSSIIGFIRELEKQRKIVRKNDAEVDRDVAILKNLEPAADFDDPHLVALVRLSGCRIICILDPRAHRFLRKDSFYKATKDRPKLYTRTKNETLLCKDNIAPCCR